MKSLSKKLLLTAFEMPTMPNEQNRTIYEVFEKAKMAKSTPDFLFSRLRLLKKENQVLRTSRKYQFTEK